MQWDSVLKLREVSPIHCNLELAFFNQEDDFKWCFLFEWHAPMFLFFLPLSILHCVTNDTALADPGVEVKGNVCSTPSPTLKVDAKSISMVWDISLHKNLFSRLKSAWNVTFKRQEWIVNPSYRLCHVG